MRLPHVDCRNAERPDFRSTRGRWRSIGAAELVTAIPAGAKSRRGPPLSSLSPCRCLGERLPFARFLLLESSYPPRSLLGRYFVRLHELLASLSLFSGIGPVVEPGRFLDHAEGATS